MLAWIVSRTFPISSLPSRLLLGVIFFNFCTNRTQMVQIVHNPMYGSSLYEDLLSVTHCMKRQTIHYFLLLELPNASIQALYYTPSEYYFIQNGILPWDLNPNTNTNFVILLQTECNANNKPNSDNVSPSGNTHQNRNTIDRRRLLPPILNHDAHTTSSLPPIINKYKSWTINCYGILSQNVTSNRNHRS